MTSEEKSTKMERDERKLRQAQAEYRKALREEKERKAQDYHKFMMGRVIVTRKKLQRNLRIIFA